MWFACRNLWTFLHSHVVCLMVYIAMSHRPYEDSNTLLLSRFSKILTITETLISNFFQNLQVLTVLFEWEVQINISLHFSNYSQSVFVFGTHKTAKWNIKWFFSCLENEVNLLKKCFIVCSTTENIAKYFLSIIFYF